MLGHLKGQLLQKQPPFLLLDVQGVGYELEAPMSTFYALPDEASDVSLFVHLVVREDAQLLYGFGSSRQLQFWTQGRLVGIIDTGEILDFARSRFLIQAFWIPRLANLQRRINKYFDDPMLLELAKQEAEMGGTYF